MEWISSDDKVATVNNGIITATGLGDCIITVKSVSLPNKTATCNVKVVAAEIPVTDISVEASASVVVNKTTHYK